MNKQNDLIFLRLPKDKKLIKVSKIDDYFIFKLKNKGKVIKK